MTKNRKTKQAARATQRTTGAKYTAARRLLHAAMAGPSTRGRTQYRADDAQGLASLRLPLGHTCEGHTPITLPLSEGHTPITWVCGAAGADKTVQMNRIALAFLNQNPTGRVFWFEPFAGHSLYWDLDPARSDCRLGRTEPDLVDEDVLQTLEDILNDPSDAPALVLLGDAEHLLMPNENPSPSQPRLRSVLQQYAATGRSLRRYVILSSQQPPTPAWASHILRDQVGSRLWIGKASLPVWESFFGRPGIEAEVRDLSVGYGWLSTAGEEPVLLRFPTTTSQ